MKLKYILSIFFLITLFLSCNNDDDKDDFDADAQALIDDEALIDFFKIHHYIPAGNFEPFGTLDTIRNGETSLFDDERLKTKSITHEDIEYKLYYLLLNEGVNDTPTRYDSVFVKYRGFTLDSIKFDENTSFNNPRGWLDLTGVIQGWKYGFPNFKSGNNITENNDPITFSDTGKGVLFIPSGLAYNNESANTLTNLPIYFHIELAQVIRADNDNDGVLNEFEDLNNDLEVFDDDTDEDGVPNYFDVDDDNDGVLTRDEDINGDGNPANDDTDGDGIVNYLDDDDDNDGILTIDEDANGDGDPRNDDTDNDGIPDYLDSDS